MKKKLFSLVLAVMMVLSILTINAFASFTDVSGHWGQGAIEKWSSKGIIQGSDGVFRPDAPITRGEMSVILDRIMRYQTVANNHFTDLDQSWYTEAVLKANAANVILGNNSQVRPKDNITREEAAVMFARAFGLAEDKKATNNGFKDSEQISTWAKGYVNALANKGFVNGDSNNNFNPKANITRAEAVKILDNSIGEIYNQEGEYADQVITGNVIINTPSVTLKDIEIKGDLIIAEGVGEGNVKLDNIKITGNTVVKGGGEHSIYFNSVTVGGALIVNKVGGNLRIVATGTTSVSVATLKSGAILVTKDLVGGGIEKVEIPADIASGQNIVLQGNFKTVENNASNMTIKATGTIEKLVLNKKTTVTGGAEVKKVTTAKDADSIINSKTVAGGQNDVNPATTTPVSSGGGSNNDSNNDNDAQTYVVTFNSNGGTVVDAVYVENDNTVTLPTDLTKEGYTFAGWYTDEELTQQFSASTPVTADMTLYAKWIDNSAPTFVISFNSNGGTVIDAVYAESNGTVNLPANPTKEGYIFAGWYTDSELIQQFDASTPVTADMMLYAKWTENNAGTHTVTFDTNGGSAIAPITVNNGETLTLPTAPTKADVTFIGWYTDSELTQQFNASTPVLSDIILYAKWSGWQEPIEIDSRFAAGYPKSSVEDSVIKLQVKLNGASPANPMEVFMVVNQINSQSNKIDTNAVIHGHAGMGDSIVYIDKASYIRVTDANEHIISTDVSIMGDNSVKIYFVVRDASSTSAAPTMLEYSQEAVAELDQRPPHFMGAYINSGRDKVVLHFGEELDTSSVPSPGDFSFSDGSISVSSVQISNNDWYHSGQVELTLASPVSNIEDLQVSYNGTVLRDQATVPNVVQPINTREVDPANLSIQNIYVSHDGKYIAVNMDKSVFMEKSKSFDVILQYGADKTTATTLVEGDNYNENWSVSSGGSSMAIQLKLNEAPTLTAGYKYFITINANDLTDFAGDTIATLEGEGVPNATSETSIEPESVVYNPADNSITVTYPENSGLMSSTVYGCFFTLTVDGQDYILRGSGYFNDYNRTVIFRQENIPFDMAAVNWTNAKISYSLDVHPGASPWAYIKFNTGMPYAGFSDVPVTTQP